MEQRPATHVHGTRIFPIAADGIEYPDDEPGE